MKNKFKGVYIAIEGGEGAGKSTAMKAIQSVIEEKNMMSINVREPGGTQLAEDLRNLVKGEAKTTDPNEEIDSYTEALIFFAARNQLLTQVVTPALKDGKTVVSDRCYLSSIAYQKDSQKLTKILSDNLTVKPDFIIYLDIDPVIGLERARNRGELDRIEQKDMEYFNGVRNSYLEEAKQDSSIIVIDASQSIVEVYNEVQKAVKKGVEKALLEKEKKLKQTNGNLKP